MKTNISDINLEMFVKFPISFKSGCNFGWKKTQAVGWSAQMYGMVEKKKPELNKQPTISSEL